MTTIDIVSLENVPTPDVEEKVDAFQRLVAFLKRMKWRALENEGDQQEPRMQSVEKRQ
jgi:hypothetical protein